MSRKGRERLEQAREKGFKGYRKPTTMVPGPEDTKDEPEAKDPEPTDPRAGKTPDEPTAPEDLDKMDTAEQGKGRKRFGKKD